jgi:hypothetical protein
MAGVSLKSTGACGGGAAGTKDGQPSSNLDLNAFLQTLQ